jgi:hypothetical protein
MASTCWVVMSPAIADELAAALVDEGGHFRFPAEIGGTAVGNGHLDTRF